MPVLQFSRAKTTNNDRRQSMGEDTLSASVFMSGNMKLTERVPKTHPPMEEISRHEE
jgi:hypothetical protein